MVVRKRRQEIFECMITNGHRGLSLLDIFNTVLDTKEARLPKCCLRPQQPLQAIGLSEQQQQLESARRQNALNHNCFKIFNSTTHSSAKESSIASPHHYETEEYPTPSSHVLPFSPHNYSAGEATQFQINNTQVYEQRNPAIGTTSENASSVFSRRTNNPPFLLAKYNRP